MYYIVNNSGQKCKLLRKIAKRKRGRIGGMAVWLK